MVRKIVGARAVVVIAAAVALLSMNPSTTAFAQTPTATSSATFTATGDGAINGTLTNKTANGGSVANQDVTLGAYQGAKDAGKRQAKTDNDGRFVFSGLATGADYTYQLSLTYQSAPYYSDPINFSGAGPGQPSTGAQPQPTAQPTTQKTASVEVYDSTSDDSVMKTSAHHFLLEPDKDTLAVSEIVIINNGSDKAFVGKESHSGTNTTLKFTLPDGAQSFEPVDGLFPSRVLQVQGGFVDTMPVYPGMSQRVWRYSFPAAADSVGFTAKLDMPADKVSVLVPDTGAKVSISNLIGPTNQDIQGEKYILFSGQNVAAGTQLQFQVDALSKVTAPTQPAQSAGTPSGSSATGGTSPVSPMIAGGVVGLVVVVFGAIMVLTRRQRAQRRRDLEMLVAGDDDLDPGSDGEVDLEAERKQLIATIAKLDDLFEQDKIGSEEYGRIRTVKKRRLIEIAKMQKTAVGAGRN